MVGDSAALGKDSPQDDFAQAVVTVDGWEHPGTDHDSALAALGVDLVAAPVAEEAAAAAAADPSFGPADHSDCVLVVGVR